MAEAVDALAIDRSGHHRLESLVAELGYQLAYQSCWDPKTGTTRDFLEVQLGF